MLAFFSGTTLLLSEHHWFRRRPLVDRLAPYLPGTDRQRSSTHSVFASWRSVAAPLARVAGDRLARAFGVTESATQRLERIHAPMDATEFRLHQLGWVGAGFAAGTMLAVLLPLPGVLPMLFLLGTPLLAFLIVEQGLSRASQRWQRHLFLELPVVAEQLGMLLGAGYSLGAAIGRLADRGKGACGRDLERVDARIRVGLSEIAALREWAEVADVAAVNRLVGVLALNRKAADLNRLISEEARSIRRDVHRELIETVERHGQHVWIPVTVATLVPGVIFLAVPFIEALRQFSNV
jgi:tight adherence protein C